MADQEQASGSVEREGSKGTFSPLFFPFSDRGRWNRARLLVLGFALQDEHKRPTPFFRSHFGGPVPARLMGRANLQRVAVQGVDAHPGLASPLVVQVDRLGLRGRVQ